MSRYSSLSYEWTISKGELAEARPRSLRGTSRFVTDYGYRDTTEGGKVKRTASEVSFNSEFIAGLTGRSLFDIDWDRVTSLERAT